MTAYRSAYDHIVGLRLEETQEARTELTPLMPNLRAVTRARLARIAAGAVGVAGALVMTVSAAWTHDTGSATPTIALLASSAALVVVWLLARAGLGIAGRVRDPEPLDLTLTGRLDEDVARIDAADPRAEMRRIERSADRLEIASVALPIAGISLLFPLLSHWLFVLVTGARNDLGSFSEWIRISLVIVGHAHIALVVCGYMFAKRVHGLSLDKLADLKIHREWLKAWMITIGVSCLPGILLILVPPLLVAATGIAFIPIVWLMLHRAVMRERSAFAFAAAASGLRLELAKQEQGQADGHDENAGGDADDRAEGEPLVVAAHRVGDGGRWG